MSLTDLPEWRALAAHRQALHGVRIADLVAQDDDRLARFSLTLGPLHADFSKHRATEQTLDLLIGLARACGVETRRDAMMSGQPINETERRAVLHTALRRNPDTPLHLDGFDVMPQIAEVAERIRVFATAIEREELRGWTNQSFSDVVNIGIGGSDLGPQLVCQALSPYARRDLRTHFVSNVDGSHLAETLRRLEPQRTLFVVASKSFTTAETLLNAHSARAWLLDHAGSDRAVTKHFVALSSNVEAAREFGIAPQNVFGFWDWVGGRYSLWSAIGLSIVLAIGWRNWELLRAGAAMMDQHFRTAPLEANLPVLLGLLGVWYRDFWGWPGQAVIPYDQYLARLPAYLQQLDMESNGKSVTLDGRAVDVPTGPLIFGEPGTNAQHSFFQWLHQGTDPTPVDFIGAVEPQHGWPEHHRMLLANMLAQSQALMQGRDTETARKALIEGGMDAAEADRLAPHKTFPGNRPSTTLLLRRLDPMALGMLLALYEHKVFVQGALWGVNSFDQMGVELGKHLAGAIGGDLAAGRPDPRQDASTADLIRRILE